MAASIVFEVNDRGQVAGFQFADDGDEKLGLREEVLHFDIAVGT